MRLSCFVGFLHLYRRLVGDININYDMKQKVFLLLNQSDTINK